MLIQDADQTPVMNGAVIPTGVKGTTTALSQAKVI